METIMLVLKTRLSNLLKGKPGLFLKYFEEWKSDNSWELEDLEGFELRDWGLTRETLVEIRLTQEAIWECDRALIVVGRYRALQRLIINMVN